MPILLAAVARADEQLPFVTIKVGVMSGTEKPMHKVFRTSSEFSNYWYSMFGTLPQPQHVDWNGKELVAIHVGHRGAFGYQARVDSIYRVGDHTVVNWVERLPANSEKAANHAISPYVIVSFPAQSGKVYFKRREEDPGHPYSPGAAVQALPFLSGGHCFIATETAEVITDPRAFTTLWASAFGKGTPPMACDFSRWRLAVIFLGQRPTPGYEPVITGVHRIGPHEVEVRYSETAPEKGKVLPQVVTNPFTIVKLPVTDDKVTVVRNS